MKFFDPTPPDSSSTPRKRPRGSPRIAKPKPPDRIYLRDIRDLTLHGGIDLSGNLVILPIFSGLGTKGIKPTDYLRQCQDLWSSRHFQKVIGLVPWTAGRPSIFHVRYPALTSALPLPAAAVIDHIVENGDNEVSSLDLALSQLARCATARKSSIFRILGECVSEPRVAMAALLSAEERYPGLLTENFRSVLEALRDFYAAIVQAEAEKHFFVIDEVELGFALNFAGQTRALQTAWIETTSWASFYKDRELSNARTREAVTTLQMRLDAGNLKELRQQISKVGGLSWAALADVGANAIMAFAHAAEIAQGQGSISPNGMSVERDLAFDGSRWEEEATKTALPRSNRWLSAMGFAWRELVVAALGSRFYRQQEFDLPQLSKAWSKRFAPESALATLLEQIPSRPIAEGGALIVRTEATTTETAKTSTPGHVRIEPAIIKPWVAATRASARLKKFPAVADRYMCLSTARCASIEAWSTLVPSLYADESQQLLWPQGRLWQAVDMVKTLASQPSILLCPEVLAKGYLRLSTEKWEQLGLSPEALKISDESSPTWSQAYDWFLGVSPCPQIPIKSPKLALYCDPTACSWPMSLIDGGIAVADVRLAVRYVAAGSDTATQCIASLSALLHDVLITNKEASASSANIDELLEQWGLGLRFEARPYFEVDGQAIEEAEWFTATKTKAGYYRLANGVSVDAAVYLAKTDQFILRKRVYAKFQSVRLSEIWRMQRQVLAESSANLSPDEYMRQLSLRIAPLLKDLDKSTLTPLAKCLLDRSLRDLEEILRPYQKEAIAWAYLRFRLGFGVCLADEMGLGKTVQAIAMLRAMGDRKKPSLVVMPKTLLYNWRREFERFGDGIRVAVYGEDTFETGQAPDIWLVTYPRLRLDQAILANQEWNMVVLDEAQAIKNAETQVSEAANQLKARYRLALTGTPVENRASELWSIVNWLNPGYLGEQSDFSTYTSMARSSEQKNALLAPLRECLDPIILRRTKSDPKVALGLPEKVFLDLSCELSNEQISLYEAVVETVLAEEAIGVKAFARRALFLKAILHLKQICLHPELFYGEQDETAVAAEIDATTATTLKVRQLVLKRLKQQAKVSTFQGWLDRSGKLRRLYEVVESLKDHSRGILIFTQYLGAADLLRRALDHAQRETIPFIHGGLSAAERLAVADEFNERCRQHREGESCPILILSLKAGGVGLNLTGADRVIHFDRWWNPAVEDQATDRAHRIGQDRSVFCHTVTTLGTIEEAIGRMFVEKRRLAEDLLGAAATEDVGDLLRDREGFLDLVDPQRMFTLRLAKQALSNVQRS